MLDSFVTRTIRAERELALLIEQRKLLLSLRLENVSLLLASVINADPNKFPGPDIARMAGIRG